MRATRIVNGQNPIISASGEYVFYGNWEVGVFTRANGTFRTVCEGWPAGELRPGVLGVTSSLDVQDAQWRRFYTIDLSSGAPRAEADVPQATVPIFAALGHIYGCKPGKAYPQGVGWAYYRDGQEMALASQEPLIGFETDGRVLMVGVEAGVVPNRLFDCATGALVREVSLDGLAVTSQFQRTSRLISGPDGAYVFQNAANGMFVNRPDNTNVQVPALEMPAGESRGDLVWWKDVMYAVTYGSVSMTDYLVMIRPADGQWGKKAICVPMHANHLTAKLTDAGELIVAGMHAATNELMVVDDLSLDQTAAEEPKQHFPAPPPPPPPPPPPDPSPDPHTGTTVVVPAVVADCRKCEERAAALENELKTSKKRVADLEPQVATLTDSLASAKTENQSLHEETERQGKEIVKLKEAQADAGGAEIKRLIARLPPYLRPVVQGLVIANATPPKKPPTKKTQKKKPPTKKPPTKKTQKKKS